MARSVVLGVDSGTQSTKVVALDLVDGKVVATGRAPHSGESVQDPRDWWEALVVALREVLSNDFDVRGISVSGQQHGMVTLDTANEPVRAAPLWNNLDAADDAERLNQLADFASETGTRLVAAVTIAKLAWLARRHPDDLDRTDAVCLPHDWLNLQLTGRLTSDRGDSSGTGWWSPVTGKHRRDLLALAIGGSKAASLRFPDVLGPDELAGTLTVEAASDLALPPGIPVGIGTGDNMAAALGIGAGDSEFVISLGTSGTAYALSDTPVADASGAVCGFADATGRFMPLACLINCTKVIDTVAALVGTDRIQALDLAASIDPGAGGILFLPYLDGERTPNLPTANGTMHGLTSRNISASNLIRAALDGVAAGLAYCVEALAALGIDRRRITLVGGGSAHNAWQQAIADATGMPVSVRGEGEHAARGAAIQAAAVVLGASVRELAERRRPDVVAEVRPRAGFQDAFRLNERRALIAEMLKT